MILIAGFNAGNTQGRHILVTMWGSSTGLTEYGKICRQ
jgi:hypothetical protein